LSKLNLASIILIPKKDVFNSIHHFRLISLINCSCKIISKILTNKLARIIDKLIDNTQTAFIKGRCIYNNIICAQKVLHQVRLTKAKGIMLKLDFEKTFDNVN
jgi:Reverse transcriptase (RNA-dependent DNA polymerase)